MKKPYFTRKNLIVLALAIFYAVIVAFTGICIEASHTLVSRRNIINIIAEMIHFKSIDVSLVGYVGLMLVSIYIVLFVASILYIRKYAINNKIKRTSPKIIIAYFCAFVACVLLSFGFTALLVSPKTVENLSNIMLFLGQSLLLGTMIFMALLAVFGGAAMLIVNFVLIDKPFRFFKDLEEIDLPEEVDSPIDVSSSFDVHADTLDSFSSNVTGVTGVSTGMGGGNSEITALSSDKLSDREVVFPSLSNLDLRYDGYAIEKIETQHIPLEELCERFRNYLAAQEGLYFDEQTIRLFVAGLGTSHFMILEGLSGTGKSSLPRYFAKFIGGNALFMPVQTTWRDKSNIIGFFNEFSKTYTETDFLLHLYHAVYNPDQIHLFVLDEMNISRVEYYFADLLSVLEYPEEDWKLRLMQLPHDFIPPAKIEDGFIRIMPNCYFVGTANKDDSTFSISDKVYDRAITMDFEQKNKAFTPQGDCESVTISHSKLQELYKEALANLENRMNENDFTRFEMLTDFVYEQFDVTFGNRVLMQIEKLVPIYLSCGGKKEEALDFIFSRKVLAKIDGRFEEYVKSALKQLLTLLHKTYGVGVFKMSERAIAKLLKKL